MLTGAFRTIRDGLLSLSYPAECRVCGGQVESWDDGVACALCWENTNLTTYFDDALCEKCGRPAPDQRVDCPRCRSLPFSLARACGAYAGALEASVLFLKVNPFICTRLRRIIARVYSGHRERLGCDVVVPVPLHPRRKRERGFNQSELTAMHLARVAGLPLDRQSLVRTKYTERHRAGLDLLDRSRSVEGAFAVRGDHSIGGRTVLLVDDVLTTGSTVCSAVRTLLEAGAVRVNVFTIAQVVDQPVG